MPDPIAGAFVAQSRAGATNFDDLPQSIVKYRRGKTPNILPRYSASWRSFACARGAMPAVDHRACQLPHDHCGTETIVERSGSLAT
jgi:hypothetical protein